jgi:beta-lactamase regulating signal transducer with metallopeptidase domain/protocatechuate 3,4-dioxygenase beta subunit
MTNVRTASNGRREEAKVNSTAISWLEAALWCIVHASWQAAALGLAVLTVCLLLGTSLQPRWRFALWLVVFARLAFPIVPTAPWSLFELVSFPQGESVVEAPVDGPPQDREIQPFADSPVPPLPSLSSPVVEAPPQPPDEEDQPAAGETKPTVSLLACLTLIWLAGALLLVGRRSRLAIRLARQRRSWQQVAEPRIRQVFEECRRELRIVWPVKLLLAPELTSPATGGVWRPNIVLPAKLVSSFSNEEWHMLLLHELLHVRRLDVLSDRLAALVAMVHWFNPIAWLALARLRRERELACDAAVLDRLDTDEAHRYGCLLLKSVEQHRLAASLSGAVEMFGPNLSLARRIHMITSHRKPTWSRRGLGILIVFLFLIVGLTDARIAGRGPVEASNESNSARPALEKTILLAGACQDEKGEALKDVRVTVYREDFEQLKTKRLGEATTDEQGRFRFTNLPALPGPNERGGWRYALTCTRTGRASAIQWIMAESPTDKITITMKPAATLQGRVTDPSGKPIVGAWVWTNGLLNDPLPGVWSSRTDAEGRYAITDLPAWDAAAHKTHSEDGRTGTTLIGCYFYVRHPDYGEQRPLYKRVPDTINITLQPAAIIEGRVLDQLTGKPAAGVVVCMQAINKSIEGGWHQTHTDRTGKYRFPSLLAASYNIWADAPERACAAIDSFAVAAGKTHTAPDLMLIEGGWIEGRLIDAETDKPISRHPQNQQRLRVAVYGPSRPKSGACCQGSDVDDRGTFRLHVAPGINYPYIMYSDVWNRTQRRAFYEKGIEVKSGEIVSLVFRILPKEPIADPDPTPVRLHLPVAAERAAAERIRQLGGWHEVDKDNHIIEVNMVYHEVAKARYDNKHTDMDEALRTMKAFPRLKRLFLCKGQATNEALASVADLKDLEVFFIWDAQKITDAGVKHLAGLTKLQNVHINNSQIGDGALEVFARSPALKHLSLQGNAFSDEGLRHLEGMKQLRSLWIGMNREPITDTGVQHLAGLTLLEQLDLQKANLSDEGVMVLKNLTNLKMLHLEGDDGPSGKTMTDASVDALAGLINLRDLWLQHTRITDQGAKRLIELPKLQTLYLSSSALSEQTLEELKKRRPSLKLYLPSRPVRE